VTQTLAAEGPNAEQIEYWNTASGPKWVALESLLDAQIGGLGRTAMDRAGIAAGERVLDVGCGCGATTLELAERVGPAGSVLGIDVSAPMLARARERVAEAGLANVDLRNVDAQTHVFTAEEGVRDVLFSRFGVMFFADPPAAFANLRGALRPDGRLAFVCWRPLAENPWMRVPVEALARAVPLPPPPEPGAPGPFAFGDADRVRAILREAGFRAVELAPCDTPLAIAGGAPLAEAVSFALQVGPASRALADASPADRERAAELLDEALAPYAGPRGVVLDSASWIVTARSPG